MGETASSTGAGLYPLRFREILRDYGFGDRWIVSQFDKQDLPADHRVAETWEVCDRPGESGLILNGALRGQTLRQAIDRLGEALLGRDIARRFGSTFPLLIKLLDASNVLGAHMHPSDDLVRRRQLDDFSGKAEAWYMLRARPDATILCGHRDGIDRQALRLALLTGDPRDCMQERAAAIGDAFLLYPGTIHYSDGGLLFYEIMQNSDLNIGLNPGRSPDGAVAREVEEKADEILEGVHFEDGFEPRTRPVTLAAGDNRRTFLIACQYFAVERLDLTTAHSLEMNGERFRAVTVIEGEVAVNWPGGTEHLRCGQSCLVPAALSELFLEPAALEPVAGEADRSGGAAAVLVATVPDLTADVVAPLRAAGVADEAIRALGGRSALNPLNALTGDSPR